MVVEIHPGRKSTTTLKELAQLKSHLGVQKGELLKMSI